MSTDQGSRKTVSNLQSKESKATASYFNKETKYRLGVKPSMRKDLVYSSNSYSNHKDNPYVSRI